jgi:hypothetical protein
MRDDKSDAFLGIAFVFGLMAVVVFALLNSYDLPLKKTLVTQCQERGVMIVRMSPARTYEEDYYCLGELEPHFVRDNYGYFWKTRPEEIKVFREWECSPDRWDLSCPEEK